jgi:hypothetical protein
MTKPCADCKTLIDSSVANEPHVGLSMKTSIGLVQGDSDYYECMECGAKLLREQKAHDPGMRWRLL